MSKLPPPPPAVAMTNTFPKPHVGTNPISNLSNSGGNNSTRVSSSLARLLERNSAALNKREPILVQQDIFHEPRCKDLPKSQLKKIRFVIVSDSHNSHDHLEMPEGDVLLHCGDMTDCGSVDEVRKFNEFLGRVKHKYKMGIYVICGNHEERIAHMTPSEIQKLFSNATYLHDSSIVLDDKIVVYGTPWVPNMSYQKHESHMKYWDNKMFYRSEVALAEKWRQIPDNTHILMTHTPPRNVRDGVSKFGCPELSSRLAQLSDVRIHCFGHVHMGYGYEMNETCNRLSINAAVDTDEQPVVVDYYYD